MRPVHNSYLNGLSSKCFTYILHSFKWWWLMNCKPSVSLIFLILSLCYSFQSGMHIFTSPLSFPNWNGLVVFLEATSLSMSYSTLLRSAYIKISGIILRGISKAWTASFKSEVTLFKLECNLLEVHVFTLRKQFYFPKIITYYLLCVSRKSESEK